jgi:hypothetical protein
MGAQRFRTPRGLDEIKKISSWEDLTPFAEVYVSTQRFKPPPEFYRMRKMRSQLAHDDANQILSVLMGVFQAYSTMWMEGVWEIVHAKKSKTKFIVSDNPVPCCSSVRRCPQMALDAVGRRFRDCLA